MRIESFREAIDLGSQCPAPVTTDDAQYSLPYGVAAALVFDRVGAAEVEAAAVADPRVAPLLRDRARGGCGILRRFPAERWARLRITLADGAHAGVGTCARTRESGKPAVDAELLDKYRALATPVLGPERTGRIEAIVGSLVTDAAALPRLRDALLESPEADR